MAYLLSSHFSNVAGSQSSIPAGFDGGFVLSIHRTAVGNGLEGSPHFLTPGSKKSSADGIFPITFSILTYPCFSSFCVAVLPTSQLVQYKRGLLTGPSTAASNQYGNRECMGSSCFVIFALSEPNIEATFSIMSSQRMCGANR